MKKIQKILIYEDEISVFSKVDGINSVTQLNSEPEENEIENIFEKYNLSDLIHYPFDLKIVRALTENEEQMKDYLETCRRAKFSNGKAAVPETIPQITYDLRKLKSNDMDIQKKVEIYKQAKETKEFFRSAKKKVTIQMGIIDKAYMEIQILLNSKFSEKVLTLSAGNSTVANKNTVEKN